MMLSLRSLALAGMTCLLAGCGSGTFSQGFDLVPGAKPYFIAEGLYVVPDDDWSSIPAEVQIDFFEENETVEEQEKRQVKGEIWTRDGIPLNQVVLVNGIEDGSPIALPGFAPSKAPPKFSKNATPIELRNALVEFAEVLGGLQPTVRKASLANYGGADGIRVEYDYFGEDDVERRGVVVGINFDEKLYIIGYSAPKIYYFKKHLMSFEGLLKSIKVAQK